MRAAGSQLDHLDFAQHAALDDLLGHLMARIVVALRAHHHHPFVLVHRLEHPLAFVDEDRERLFHIDILAGRAGHDGKQRVPVVGCGYHHAIDVFVFVHLAKIAVALGIGVFQVRQTFLQARLVDIAQRYAVDIRGMIS